MPHRAALCIMLIGCTAKPTDTGVVIDTLPSGAIHVANSAPARWADTSGWKIVLEIERTFPMDSAGSLEAPNYPYAFPDGGVVVLDQMRRVVQRYDAALTPLGTFARKGGGPGEFENPGLATIGDTVVALDGARLQLFSKDGTYLSEATVPFTDGLGIRNTNGHLALVGRSKSGGPAVLWWSIADERVVDSMIGPKGPEQRMWEECRFVIPYQAEMQMTPTRSGLAWYGVNDADRFVLTRTGRDTVRIIETPGRPRFPVNARRLDEMFAPGGPFLKMCPVMKRSDVPSQAPAWSWLTIDAEDNLWVARPAAYGGSFDVYDSTGRWLGEVPNPIGRGENDYWQGDVIITVSESDESGYTLRRYKVRR